MFDVSNISNLMTLGGSFFLVGAGGLALLSKFFKPSLFHQTNIQKMCENCGLVNNKNEGLILKKTKLDEEKNELTCEFVLPNGLTIEDIKKRAHNILIYFKYSKAEFRYNEKENIEIIMSKNSLENKKTYMDSLE